MIVVLFLLVCVAVIVVVGRSVRARRHPDRDDLRRIGDESSVDRHEAARRAQGRSAWSRADLNGL